MNVLTLIRQFTLILLYLFISWIIIHFLALFGIFLALAIPLLHLFFYPHILCFYCQLNPSRHNFKHSLIDSVLILVITLISIPLIFLEYRLVSYFTSPSHPATARFLIPAKNQYKVGESFPIKIELANIPTSINVVQADLSFDPTLLEAVNLDTSNAFVKFFVQQETNNDSGYVRLAGGVPNPGYNSPSGLLGTVYFRAKQPGAAQIQYLDSSLVLANDGRGTNLLSDYPTTSVLITPAAPASSTIPTNLNLRSQVQGDSDTTVLSFSQYAEDLPQPFANTLGVTTTASPLPLPSPKPESSFLNPLVQLDQFIVSLWKKVVSGLAK